MMWRTTTSHHSIRTLEELRQLIQRHDAWEITLQEFQQRAGYRKEGNEEYITHFNWGGGNSTLHEVWELVQYIHRHYGAKS